MKTYQQPDVKKAKQFWGKIWERKKKIGNDELINNIGKFPGLKDGPYVIIHME